MWQRWDALWYQHIALEGYRGADGSTAFFPLYPLLSRFASTLIGGNLVLAELLVSSAAFVAAVWWLHRLTLTELGRAELVPSAAGRLSPATVTVLLVILFPTGFFLLAPYTEGLFLAMTVASFALAREGRPWLAGAVGLLAGLSRAQGAFLALPLAYEQLKRWWPRRRQQFPPLALIASALPAIALLGVLSLQASLGDGSGGSGPLAKWGYKLVPPWESVAASWALLSGTSSSRGTLVEVEALNLAALIGATALAGIAVARLPLSHALYAIPSIALLLMREMWFSPLMSVSRYVLVVFPCFIVLGSLLTSHPRVLVGWLVVSGGLMFALFHYWVRWGFVG